MVLWDGRVRDADGAYSNLYNPGGGHVLAPMSTISKKMVLLVDVVALYKMTQGKINRAHALVIYGKNYHKELITRNS